MKQKGATQRLTHISEKVDVPCFQKQVQDWSWIKIYGQEILPNSVCTQEVCVVAYLDNGSYYSSTDSSLQLSVSSGVTVATVRCLDKSIRLTLDIML